MNERRKQHDLLQPAKTDIGRRIDAVRLERGWTVGDVARRAGIGNGQVSHLRLGDRQAERIGIAKAFALADALEVEARWLFLGEGPKTAVGGTVGQDEKTRRRSGEAPRRMSKTRRRV